MARVFAAVRQAAEPLSGTGMMAGASHQKVNCPSMLGQRAGPTGLPPDDTDLVVWGSPFLTKTCPTPSRTVVLGGSRRPMPPSCARSTQGGCGGAWEGVESRHPISPPTPRRPPRPIDTIHRQAYRLLGRPRRVSECAPLANRSAQEEWRGTGGVRYSRATCRTWSVPRRLPHPECVRS